MNTLSEADDNATCMTMCPEAEIRFRESRCLIHPLESSDQTASTSSSKSRRADHSRMVKVYSRPAAGRDDVDPSQLRPFPVLKRTVSYLLRLANESTASWTLVYEFVADRLRAIRQDMIIQRMNPLHTLELLEAMIPFYFIAEYRCESRHCPGYDRKLHSTQLEECLCRWKEVFLLIGSSSDISLCYLLRNADKTETYQDYTEWKTQLPPRLRSVVGLLDGCRQLH
uniref:SAC3/GANP/THP3 conserved domain-containing protein n=1 Tax=Plectus sambesii TaxID=2011161 RepID=A0A914W233_9BILA